MGTLTAFPEKESSSSWHYLEQSSGEKGVLIQYLRSLSQVLVDCRPPCSQFTDAGSLKITQQHAAGISS